MPPTPPLEPDAQPLSAGTWEPMTAAFSREEPDADNGGALVLSEAARHLIAIEWNEPVPDYPDAGLMPDLLAARAAAQPNAVALVCGAERIRYRELDAWAGRLADRLRELGVGPEVIVGVLLERSPAMVASLLAIWKCGAAYLPLDPEYPPERMMYILQDGLAGPGPRIIMSDRELASWISELGIELFLVGSPETEVRSRTAELSLPPLRPEHPAYLIYTSGSTGRPKGIVVSHEALANRILWSCAAEFGPGDAFLHKTTLTFDVSLPEIFAPLVAGGRCVLARPGGHRDLPYLADLIAQESITHVSFPPSALRLLLEIPDAAVKLRSLRVVITGGESVPPDLPASVRAVIPATLYNRYGPTEATVSVLTGACDPESPGAVPLGRPIARSRIYVLDEQMRLLPPLAPGEIHIGGICLARGYLGRPDLTAERFVPDPIGKEPGARLYRTGDRGRLRPDGTVEFLGRLDYQVKIRGFRVEIEEIEVALGAHPTVREAVVIADEETATGSLRLIAFLVPEGSATPDPGELRRFLAGRLPSYMIPSTFVLRTDFPRTLSGKVDRSALAMSARSEARADRPSLVPQNGLKSVLAGYLQELLQVPRIEVGDNLLELGCHSLLLVRFQSRLREALGIELPLADILRNPSVGALARLLETGTKGGEITAEQLAAEATLEPDIRPAPDQGVPTALPEAVLLTGATGFLGAHLLSDLLDRTSARLHCLVRAADERQGMEALRRTLDRYGLWREEAVGRIIPVPGDLARPRLGLTETGFREMAETVDAIYHAGALVNYAYPYEALRSANVEGTRELLRMTVAGRAKILHHISSLSVLEKIPHRRSGAAPEVPLDGDPAGLTGGYRQSKWVAERLVQIAIERGVPATIFRPGWITGSSSTGAINPADFLVRLLVGSLQTGMVPDLGPIEVCPTPVDWVGAGIAWLSLRPESVGQVFHLINPRPVAFEKVLELFQDLGFPLRKVPVHHWAASLANLAGSGDSELLEPLEDFLRQVVSEQEDLAAEPGRFQPLRFASAATQAALAAGSLECPRVDRRLLETYLAFLAPQYLLSAGSR
jgi:myxalamid-type nonribosomal peptide synthetase MxaA